MDLQQAVLSGASIGLTIAAPVGPMAVIVIRRTVANGFAVGFVTGAGASTIHLIYATIAIVGVDQISKLTSGHQNLMTAVTAIVLLFFAVRILRPRRPAQAAVSVRRSLFGHYASALAFNSMNPMGFALVIGAVTAVSGLAAQGSYRTVALAGGVFAGSLLWWIGLVAVTTTIGVRFSPRTVRLIDIAAGMTLLALALSTASHLV